MSRIDDLHIDILSHVTDYLKCTRDVCSLLALGVSRLYTKLCNGGIRHISIDREFGSDSLVIGSRGRDRLRTQYIFDDVDNNLVLSRVPTSALKPLQKLSSISLCSWMCVGMNWEDSLCLTSLESIFIRFETISTVTSLFEIIRSKPVLLKNLKSLIVEQKQFDNAIAIINSDLFADSIDLPNLLALSIRGLRIQSLNLAHLPPSLTELELEFEDNVIGSNSLTALPSFALIQSLKLTMLTSSGIGTLLATSLHLTDLKTLHVTIWSFRSDPFLTECLPRSLTDLGIFLQSGQSPRINFDGLPPNLLHLRSNSQLLPLSDSEVTFLPKFLKSVHAEWGFRLQRWSNVVIPRSTILHKLIGSDSVSYVSLDTESWLKAACSHNVESLAGTFRKNYLKAYDIPDTLKILKISSHSNVEEDDVESIVNIGTRFPMLTELNMQSRIPRTFIWPRHLTRLDLLLSESERDWPDSLLPNTLQQLTLTWSNKKINSMLLRGDHFSRLIRLHTLKICGDNNVMFRPSSPLPPSLQYLYLQGVTFTLKSFQCLPAALKVITLNLCVLLALPFDKQEKPIPRHIGSESLEGWRFIGHGIETSDDTEMWLSRFSEQPHLCLATLKKKRVWGASKSTRQSIAFNHRRPCIHSSTNMNMQE